MFVAGAGLAATLVACGDDDDSGFTVDSGGPEATVEASADAADAAKGDAGTFAKLTFINAASDLGPAEEEGPGGINATIRICFEQSVAPAPLSVAPYPPLPDTKPSKENPGIRYGTGGTFPSFGLDLENRALKPYIMAAKTLKAKNVLNPGNGSPGTTCDEIVGSTKKATFGLVENTDYWVLPEIPAGTFKKEKAYVIALVGCVGNATITPKEKCGTDFAKVTGAAGVGNLSAIIKETNRTPVSATDRGIQVFYASAQANATFGPLPFPLTPGFTTPADPDGGSWEASVFTPATTAPIVYGDLTPAQTVAGNIDTQLFALNKTRPDGMEGPLAPLRTVVIQVFSGLNAFPNAPSVYTAGANYVFIPVGDPAQPTFQAADGGGLDGGAPTDFSTKSFHYLAFPTDPVIENYKP